MKDQLQRFNSGAATDIGKVRSENEDSYLVLPEIGVWAVADGMGGHEAGSFASTTIVDALRNVAAPDSVSTLLTCCRERLASANRSLLQVSRDGGGIVIGATVAALLACGGYYACVWSGDSRIYLLRHRKITQISRDHTEVAELIAEGILSAEEAHTWPRRNVVTRAVGVYPELDLEVAQGKLEKDDIFIICSDGLTAHVSDREILAFASENPPQSACDLLVALTIERGAIDNVTVIIVHHAPHGSTAVSRQSPARAAPQER
jgi:protein phosphatase